MRAELAALGIAALVAGSQGAVARDASTHTPTPLPRPYDVGLTSRAPVSPIVRPAPITDAADGALVVARDAAPAVEAIAAKTPPAGGLKALVARFADREGIPFGIADAVVQIESRYNARAANHSNMGLMQISTATARANGFSGSPSKLLDAETNLQFGMKVLAASYRAASGDVCLTLMRYQSGHRATHMSAANRVYCARARQLMAKI